MITTAHTGAAGRGLKRPSPKVSWPGQSRAPPEGARPEGPSGQGRAAAPRGLFPRHPACRLRPAWPSLFRTPGVLLRGRGGRRALLRCETHSLQNSRPRPRWPAGTRESLSPKCRQEKCAGRLLQILKGNQRRVTSFPTGSQVSAPGVGPRGCVPGIGQDSSAARWE